MKDKEQDKKEKKKKNCPEKKRPSPPYILWCKDQWNEVIKAEKEKRKRKGFLRFFLNVLLNCLGF